MAIDQRLTNILRKTKVLAREYYKLTGRPLGVTGEVAEYEAIRLLGLEPAPVRQSGFDAVRRSGKRRIRVQIKGRCLFSGGKPGQRLGRIDLTQPFDTVLLVLLDEHFNATAMYEAQRREVAKALRTPGSKARNERGALAVSKFKAIGKQVWSKGPT